MGDAVKITHVFRDGTQEVVDDPLVQAKEIMRICGDLLIRLDIESFMAWLGSIIDEWAICHHLSGKDAEDLIDILKMVAMNIHNDSEFKFPFDKEVSDDKD